MGCPEEIFGDGKTNSSARSRDDDYFARHTAECGVWSPAVAFCDSLLPQVIVYSEFSSAFGVLQIPVFRTQTCLPAYISRGILIMLMWGLNDCVMLIHGARDLSPCKIMGSLEKHRHPT